MRTSAHIVITAVALAIVPTGFAADTIAWGSTVDGLRIGITYGSDASKPTLRILFENVGSEVLDVLIGHEVGSPIYDSLNFIATAPDGKKQVGFHRSVFTPIAGLVLPFSVRFTAGQIHELEFLLADIIYPSGAKVTLETLAKQGWSLRVQFAVNRRSADWANSFRPWVGVISSAEISPGRCCVNEKTTGATYEHLYPTSVDLARDNHIVDVLFAFFPDLTNTRNGKDDKTDKKFDPARAESFDWYS